jgi:hypothetical protein
MMICLRPSDPEMCDHLAVFLRRHDCRAEAAEAGTVLVAPPHTFHREQARMELSLYVRLWQALNGVSVRIERAESFSPQLGTVASRLSA